MRLLEVYEDKVHGAIKGLDRIRFRGTLRWLANVEGLRRFVSMSHIALKDFGAWAEAKTKHLRQSCERQAATLGIATHYLTRGGVNKEALARRLAGERGIVNGPICQMSAVEPCLAPAVMGKAYNKSASILRVETTLNNTRDMKVYRTPENHPEAKPSWQKLRKGVADLDYKLLTFLGRGEWALNGFRNRDVRAILAPPASGRIDAAAGRRLSAKATRCLSLLRAHGWIEKVSRTHRYVLTETGRRFTTALLCASTTDVKALVEFAA